jgi:CheY-like chemotaxis protein
MKYLVVDDSNMARKMSKKAVESVVNEEDEVLTAVNGLDALEQYKVHKPKLVLMDLTMPVMDGFEAIKEIRAFDENAKIVVVSADIQKGAMDKAKENGAIGFIKKPIDISKVKSILQNLNA